MGSMRHGAAASGRSGEAAMLLNEVRGRAFALRRVAEEDAEFVLHLRRSRHAQGHLHPVPDDVGTQREWIRSHGARPDDHYFVVHALDTGRPEGLVGIHGIDLDARSGEWGRWILIPGSAAAPESVDLILRFGFESLDLTELRSRTVADNRRVLGFLESLGLGSGVTRPGAFDFDGRSVDAVEHRITREAWESVRIALAPAVDAVAAARTRRTRGRRHDRD